MKKGKYDTYWGHLALAEAATLAGAGRHLAQKIEGGLEGLAEQLDFESEEEMLSSHNIDIWEGEYEGHPVIAVIRAQDSFPNWNFHLFSQGRVVGSLEELDDLDNQIKELKGVVQEQGQEFKEQATQLAEAQAEIERLKAQIKELDW